MQECFQNLPGDRAPAQQPRGTQGSLAVKICHERCPRATETKSNVPMTAMGIAWTHRNPEQTTASHTSTYRLFLIYLSQAELQAPAWYTAVMHSSAHSDACFTVLCISTGHSNPQVGTPGCTIQEIKERPLPPLQFALQLEGCLQNSIIPQPLPKTTGVKWIYINKLPSS